MIFSAQLIFITFFGLAAVWFGIVVFRTYSMVRSAIALLFSQTALGALFLTLQAEFLGVLQIMMMATEMSVMAIFMVMFMMDPGGLGKMDMTHQKRLSIIAGVVTFILAVVVAVYVDWGPVAIANDTPTIQIKALGVELLGRSMLVFETAGITILTAMIAAIAVAIQPKNNNENTQNKEHK
jgi:NADH:ubiquinone oxidoreductase subunit 6 (subunit J)